MDIQDFRKFGIDVPYKSNDGGDVYAICPKCSHDRKKKYAKCLSVNVGKGVWFCRHCGWSGGIESTKKNYVKPIYIIKESEPLVLGHVDKLADFFSGRCISLDLVKRMGISLDRIFMPSEDKEIDVIRYPFWRDGECIDIKYRGLHDKSYIHAKDAEKVFYGLDTIIDSEQCIVCEGLEDCLSFLSVGVDNVLSVPNGAPPVGANASSMKFEYLESSSSLLAGMKKIILACDNDGPGKVLQAELARRLGHEKCWRIQWPDGCKDANDVLMIYGSEEVKSLVSNAKPWPIDGIITAGDVLEDVISLYFNGIVGGVSTGWNTLDKYYTVRPGEVTIITGVPSHGKTLWLDNLVQQLAMLHHWAIGVFSPESFPVYNHVAHFAEKHSGLPFNEGPSRRMEIEDLRRSVEWMDDKIIFISPSDEDVSLDSILTMAKKLVFRYGIKLLVIDPWNDLDHSRDRNVSVTEYISISLTKIRRFARSNGCHVGIVAHPTKLKKKDDGTYQVATPYDIADSAAFYNRLDNCITIWKDHNDLENKITVHVQKVKFREVGSVGQVDLKLDTTCGKFSDMYPL